MNAVVMTRRPIVLSVGAAITLSVIAWLVLHEPDALKQAPAPKLPEAELSVADDHGRLREVEQLGARAEAADATLASQSELADSGAWSAPLRGRVVDARTNEGVPKASVRIRGEDGRASTDDLGAFESARAFGQSRFRVVAEDQLTSKTLDEVVHVHSMASCDRFCQLFLRAQIGPTYEIELLGASRADGWQAHLVERRGALDVRTWSERECFLDETSGKYWLRYETVEHEPDPTLVPCLVVTNEAEHMRGEAVVAATLGRTSVVVPVAEWGADLVGKVTDTEGHAVEAAVIALPRGLRTEAGWPEERTDDAGRYAFTGLAPGRLRVFVASHHRESVFADVELIAGEVRQLDFTLPVVRIAGDIEGVLVGPVQADAPEALMQLRSADGGPTVMVEFAGLPPRLFHELEQEPPGRTRFFFENVPEGRYRINVIPFDGRHYEPDELVVDAPSNSAVFTTTDGLGEEGPREIEIRVRDRVTGAPLEQISRVGHFWMFWSPEVDPASGVEGEGWGDPRWEIQWLISAPGYVPAFVPISAAEEVDGELVIDVKLEPGFGAGLILLDARRTLGGALLTGGNVLPMPSLAGARILAGGRVLGTSDANGLALCRSDVPIEAFDVQLEGWSLLTVQRFLGHAQTPDGIGFVWMTRD